jgi:glutamate racemase
VRIGVFDSGVGGLSVTAEVRRAFPEHHVEFVTDSEHLPYGSKTPQQLYELSLPILEQLSQRVDVIVIACNTLTTNVIGELRNQLNVPLVGLEPMVKPAAKQTKSGIIAVCATPATLASPRYADLKRMYATGVTVLEPDCSRWAQMIETDRLRIEEIKALVDEVCAQGADVIVLGCTHYHWIEEAVREAAEGKAVVIQPEQAVIKQLQRVLAGL